MHVPSSYRHCKKRHYVVGYMYGVMTIVLTIVHADQTKKMAIVPSLLLKFIKFTNFYKLIKRLHIAHLT